jgi:acylglycerol lipase
MGAPLTFRENSMHANTTNPPYAPPEPALEDQVIGAEGCPLFYQSWDPVGDARGLVLICPGIDDHSDRYPHLVEALTQHGYATVAYDHRGNGRSEGTRLHVDRFDQYVQDLATVRQQARTLWPSMPWFLFAHSMGSTVALSYLVQGLPSPDGLISSGTALKVGDGFSPFLLMLNRALAGISPRLRLVSLPREGISRDEAWMAWSNSDPLVVRRPGTARLGTEILSTLETLRAQLDRIELPLLVLHGTADRLIDPEGAELLYRQAASSDKTLRLYEGAYHEVVNDLPDAREAALKEIVNWLDRLTQR